MGKSEKWRVLKSKRVGTQVCRHAHSLLSLSAPACYPITAMNCTDDKLLKRENGTISEAFYLSSRGPPIVTRSEFHRHLSNDVPSEDKLEGHGFCIPVGRIGTMRQHDRVQYRNTCLEALRLAIKWGKDADAMLVRLDAECQALNGRTPSRAEALFLSNEFLSAHATYERHQMLYVLSMVLYEDLVYNCDFNGKTYETLYGAAGQASVMHADVRTLYPAIDAILRGFIENGGIEVFRTGSE